MRKNPFFSVVLLLFLLVPAAITWGQTITSQKGLTTAEFNLPQGKITVYLPDDIRPGDQISGTVQVSPSGRNARQQENNLEELLRSTLLVLGQSMTLDRADKAFTIRVPSDLNSFSHSLELRQASARPLVIQMPGEIFNSTKPSPDRCVIPSHVLTGETFGIAGPFDGNLDNTRCRVGAQNAKILAESPRQTIAEWPQALRGSQNCSVSEPGGIQCTETSSGVDMIVETGKLNLQRGESTFIDITVTGLENLPDKATLTVINITPHIVTMTNGNTQVFTIWPLPDSSRGNFRVHCPANSISTGNFTVNIDLELPEKGKTYSTVNEEIPAGYVRKTCTCEISQPVVSKRGNTYTVQATGNCTGAHGIGISTFERCSLAYLTYDWKVTSGNRNVDLPSNTNSRDITVQPNHSGAFIMEVTVTAVCRDGTTCTKTTTVNQEGATVPPGTQVRDPVTSNPTTERPPPTKCSCNCTVAINRGGIAGKDYGFTAVANPQCSGTSGTGATRVRCSVSGVSYRWNLIGGAPGARIKGAANAAGVTVEKNGVTGFVLQVIATVTCSDGTTCECPAVVEVPGEEDKSCRPMVAERIEPAMNGKLAATYIGKANNKMLPRDEFIILQAAGADWDQLIFRCDPSKPHCPDDTSQKVIPMAGRVRFEWLIRGEGTFVQLGCLPADKTAFGERVIFKPWYLPLPQGEDTSAKTEIELRIIDDASPAPDLPVTKIITVTIKRFKKKPDFYEVSIVPEAGAVPDPPQARQDLKTCLTVGPKWTPGNDILKPAVIKPVVPDNDKMVLGQWLLLKTNDQPDTDRAEFNCTSAAQCETSSIQKDYADKVEWSWQVIRGGGTFLTGGTGQVVIYEPPSRTTDAGIEVVIRVTAKNAAGARADPEKDKRDTVIRLFIPGIELDFQDVGWLPTDNDSVEVKSRLMYKKDTVWNYGPDHQCRIHFFDLLDISREKGISMNYPVPDSANQCRDLILAPQPGAEVFDDKEITSCRATGNFTKARSNEPMLNAPIRVHSRDFGAYGFLRSNAYITLSNVAAKTVRYISIPETGTFYHPYNKVKKTIYPDNRITLPRDIDENRIPDWGWPAFGGARMGDSILNNTDYDSWPVGDGFQGDGLSTYEEYRGFRVLDGGTPAHVRTNYLRKDLFVMNKNSLPLGQYMRLSEVQVHTIDSSLYVNDDTRVVNMNSNPLMHLGNQKGIRLLEFGFASEVKLFRNTEFEGLLGVAVSSPADGNTLPARLEDMTPTRPNEQLAALIFTGRIAQVCSEKGMSDSLAKKIEAVTTHELLHGNNVCHHGEGDPRVKGSSDVAHGLRSGNMSCVMRYDNKGVRIQGYRTEPIGSDLCTSAAGTGYNNAGRNFGDAARGRGNCKGQIRISGLGRKPRVCGNR